MRLLGVDRDGAIKDMQFEELGCVDAQDGAGNMREVGHKQFAH